MRKVWALIVIAAVIGIGAVCVALSTQPSAKSLPGPVSHARISPPASASVSAGTTTTTQPSSPPISLQIPEIGVSVSLAAPLGLAADGTVDVPSGTTQPAWYDGSPIPGQIGSSVILGHVDSYQGPGIFFRLRELIPGQTFTVTLANGTVETFKVTYVGEYAKAAFPSALVYESHGYAGLDLVTCGGVFNPATGHYESNIVAFSQIVGTT